MAESVMIALTKKGIPRQEAHELIRKCSFNSEATKKSFKKVLSDNEIIKITLTKEELDDALKPERYIGKSEEIVENITTICS